jgi:chromosomal replication initiator protein
MDIHTLWDQMLHALSGRVGPQDVEIWLGPAHAIGLDGQRLLVEVPNRYYADWIGDNYETELAAEATRLSGAPIRLEYVSREDPQTGEAPAPVSRAPPAEGT